MKRPFPIHDKLLEKDIYAGLVTSLCFHSNDILISGHGPFLKIYNVQTNKCLNSQLVLPYNRIHRIVPVDRVENNTRIIAVYGSKFLSIIELKVVQDNASITVKKTLGPVSDWIMDAQWLKDDSTNQENPTQLALAFAHNFVEIYNIEPTVPELLYSIQCQVRCILNSARLFGTTRQDLMLASGTVFNDIYLWKVGEKNQEGDGQVFKELKGHEGVIFSIRFSENGSQIVSASDDRTIRVWPLDSNEESIVLFGHTARVWDCLFVDDYLVSISEDSTCRVWRNSLKAKKKDDDENDCIACWEGHAGKNIWSCAVNPEHKIVATGGQDSGILLWSLISIENNKIDAKDDLNTYGLPKERGKDSIRNFALVNQSTLLAVTADGYLLKTNTLDNQREWTEVLYDSSLKNHNVMKASECGRVIVLGNNCGDLIIISPEDAFEPMKLNFHKQKVFDVFVQSSSDVNIIYIISNSFNEPLLFHKLDLTNSSSPSICTLYNLKMPNERTTVLCTGFSEHDGLFICGTRESNLILYYINPTSVADDSLQIVEPSLLLPKAHDNQAVTSIIFQQGTLIDEEIDKKEDDEENNIAFWTTGRDGCFNRYRISSLEAKSSIEKIYTNKVTKGLLEGAVLVDGDLLLLGFFRKSFFVYNEKKNFNVLSIACGGGHRRWEFHTKDAKLTNAFFGFTKKEGICTYFRDTTNLSEGFEDSILQDNYHGREVRAIQFLSLWDDMKEAPLLFATAGEDTLLRIQQYTPWTSSKFTTLASLRKHTTVVKNINYSKGISTLLFTSGGLEELRCWKIEATLPKGSNLAHLNCIELAVCPTLSQDIETRIMDTTTFVIDAELGLHLIGAVYSDAMIRFWLFNERTNQFSLAGDGTWHAKCILQIKHIVFDGRIIFFTSATDGKVAFWDLTDILGSEISQHNFESEPTKAAFRLGEPLYYYSTHMSGVNALEIIPYKDEKHMLIVTGGEDNAITASLFSIQNQKITPIGNTFTIPDAHASSITGIKMIDNAIFTISTDQRLNMWSINDIEGGVSLRLINASYMDVPDPSAIDGALFNGNVHIAVTGVGLQSVQYHQ